MIEEKICKELVEKHNLDGVIILHFKYLDATTKRFASIEYGYVASGKNNKKNVRTKIIADQILDEMRKMDLNKKLYK